MHLIKRKKKAPLLFIFNKKNKGITMMDCVKTGALNIDVKVEKRPQEAISAAELSNHKLNTM